MIKSHLLYQLSYEVKFAHFFQYGDLGGARTLDPMIKSHLLYQLSYEVIFATLSPDCGCKDRYFFRNYKFFRPQFALLFIKFVDIGGRRPF